MGKKAEESERYAHCQSHHAMRRARERLGLNLEYVDLAILKTRIERGAAKRLVRISKQRTLYEMVVQGKKCRVLWDRKTQQIVTFFTLDMEIRRDDTAFRGRELLREEYTSRPPRPRHRLRDCKVLDGTDGEDV